MLRKVTLGVIRLGDIPVRWRKLSLPVGTLGEVILGNYVCVVILGVVVLGVDTLCVIELEEIKLGS